MIIDEERTIPSSYSSFVLFCVDKPNLYSWFQMNTMHNRNVKKVLKVLLVFEFFQCRILVKLKKLNQESLYTPIFVVKLSLRKKRPYSEFSVLYFPALGLNTGKYRPEKLRIRTLFTQYVSNGYWQYTTVAWGWSVHLPMSRFTVSLSFQGSRFPTHFTVHGSPLILFSTSVVCWGLIWWNF